MSKVLTPKYKVDRRLGVNLWGRPKSPINTRPTRPGQHGKTMKKKLSSFGLHLAEKQKLQFYYAMKEKQFRKFFISAVKSKGNVASSLIERLESRLDIFVYRMKWAPTIFAAKQLVKHKHILVNGKVLSISSYLLNLTDVVSLKENIKNHKLVLDSEALQERQIPQYYEISDSGSAKMIKKPTLEEVPYPITINPQLIVEYYSRRV
jgi:small subunit ribosomal protein S4